jgi:hypothetical protein
MNETKKQNFTIYSSTAVREMYSTGVRSVRHVASMEKIIFCNENFRKATTTETVKR